ncbi:hypothetical protein AUC69_10635 [Methyloceanibacter superfactus]|uniref:Uncharacterized protein n=1 Tax=Methyloceanibacter superfactus TaxID=1774969 RepID=A0A1E3VXS4_9HYPH|nr:hypothetical protein AUC69_10635 [Methyloceanibacter superfactus]
MSAMWTDAALHRKPAHDGHGPGGLRPERRGRNGAEPDAEIGAGNLLLKRAWRPADRCGDPLGEDRVRERGPKARQAEAERQHPLEERRECRAAEGLRNLQEPEHERYAIAKRRK